MNEELLKEFYIVKCGDDLIINATDNAYNLLKLNTKIKNLKNGYIMNSIDNSYYINAFVNFLKNNYTINGLIRESRGNSHDASCQKEIIIFDDNNYWKDELGKYKNQKPSLYESSPIIVNKNNITKEIIDEWTKDFDLSFNGEGERIIYCSYNDGSGKFAYSIKKTHILGSANDKMYESELNNFTFSPIFLKRIK